jgi:predicted AlkP superfamily pyrophosphatase or phosphodiesterase
LITAESHAKQRSEIAPTIMVCIDAFSQTYLSKENTPFMYETANRGLRSTIDPLFAFRGIETTMFTGVWPNVHGTWTEICLRDRNELGNAKMGKILVKLLDILSSDKARKIGRVAIQRLLDHSSVRLTPNLIPAEAFGFFEPSQKKAIFQEGSAKSISTLFDLLRRQQLEFAFVEPPIFGGDTRVVDKIAKLANAARNIKLWYVKFGRPDKVGHIFGPSPQYFSSTLREVDNYVRQAVKILEKKYDSEVNIMIMADHGMSKVNNHYDLMGGLKTLKSTIYKDYVPFLDSTMARFWFMNDNSRREIENFLSGLNYGHLLSSAEIESLHIPNESRYGETIFAIDEGNMVYPDFWSGTRKAIGMHGYAFPKSDESIPVLIANKEMSSHLKIKGSATYIDVFNSLKTSLAI